MSEQKVPEQKTGSAMEDLLLLMARLRDPENGCPWDIKQNYDTIAPSTIEEAYEVADAIERKDYEHLKEELGDLLFQVVFYAQMGREDGLFDFDDIARGITDKLIRRHPHVFPGGDLHGRVDASRISTETDVKAQWEAIKQAERSEKGQHGVLDDVPRTLPAIQRAHKLQQRAAGVGFDWPDVAAVIDKVQEELGELKEAIATDAANPGSAKQEVEHELGDLLFSIVNLARHLRIDAESSLRACNRRFVQRFSYIERKLEAQGRSPDDANLEELDQLWDQAKQQD